MVIFILIPREAYLFSADVLFKPGYVRVLQTMQISKGTVFSLPAFLVVLLAASAAAQTIITTPLPILDPTSYPWSAKLPSPVGLAFPTDCVRSIW